MEKEVKLGERIFRLGSRIAKTRLRADLVSRMRLLLLIAALLTLYVAFKYNQDWYVEEFATYDWARGLGF